MSSSRNLIPPHVLWPAIVIGFLAASLTVCGLTVFFAISDPSFAVEEDYYEKALQWDDQAAQNRVNEALGWTARASLSAGESHRDADTISLSLRDENGEPIRNATIAATVFHPARSADRHEVVFEFRDGIYIGSGQFERAGNWRAIGTVNVRVPNDSTGSDTIFTFECLVKREKGGA